MISLYDNRILIKLFYDLNPRMAANILPVAGQCLAYVLPISCWMAGADAAWHRD
jgi:hypothetical protein